MSLLSSNRLPLLEEGTKTVTTAGTSVQLTTIKGKRAVIQSVQDNGSLGANGSIIAVGNSNVDATTSPPTCRAVLYPTQRENFDVIDASELYIDANEDGAKIHFCIYG